MATIAELNLKIEALETQNAELVKANADMAVEKKSLEDTIAESAASGQPVAKKVPGSYLAKWQDAEGDDQSKKVEFKDGVTKVRVPKLQSTASIVGIVLSSEQLIKVANGKSLSGDYKTDVAHKMLTKESAEGILTHLAQIGASFIK